MTLPQWLERFRKRNGNRIRKRVMLHGKARQMEKEGTAVTSISALPAELIVDILSRLTPKSFFRCQSVCKSWLSLSSEAFRRNRHLQHTLRGIFYNRSYINGNAAFPNLSIVTNNKVKNGDKIISGHPCLSLVGNLRLRDCCNGLILLEALHRKRSFYVFNPATQTLFNIDLFKFLQSKPYYRDYSLAFDTRVPSRFHIFCFASNIRNVFEVEYIYIFSFERGKLKSRYRKKMASNIILYSNMSSFVGGKLYRQTTKYKILCIDPKKLSYQMMCMPDLEGRTFAQIGNSQGLLHCMSACKNKGLYIWLLKSNAPQEWQLKYRFNLQQIYSTHAPRFPSFDICNLLEIWRNFAFHPWKDIIFLPLGFGGFLLFDMSSGECKEVEIFQGILRDCWLYTPNYLV